MISFPNAKINIGLYVLDQRADGYHNLESIFYPLGWNESLEILKADHTPKEGKTKFINVGLSIPGDARENLVVKAYNLIDQDFDLPPIEIYLYKAIPMGAGLGGGSADAAFMIKNLNALFDLKLKREQQLAYAQQLGSDCPFFIDNTPAYVVGRGDQFSPTTLPLANYHAVVVHPGIHVSTKEAYQLVHKRGPKSGMPPLTELAQLPLNEWKEVAINDFETGMIAKHPLIGELKQQLYELGAVYASMTGSGSALYGIFEYPMVLPPTLNRYHYWSGELS